MGCRKHAARVLGTLVALVSTAMQSNSILRLTTRCYYGRLSVKQQDHLTRTNCRRIATKEHQKSRRQQGRPDEWHIASNTPHHHQSLTLPNTQQSHVFTMVASRLYRQPSQCALFPGRRLESTRVSCSRPMTISMFTTSHDCMPALPHASK